MNVHSLMQNHRSIRRFDPRPVEAEKVQAILDCMRLAPSAANRQKWTFYAIESQEKREAIAQATGNAWWAQAPLILAVTCDDCGVMTNGHRSDTVDCSIAMTLGMLCAEDLGLGTCWVASYTEDAVRSVLQLSPEYSVPALLIVGYGAEAPEARPRKPLSEISTIM